MVLSSSPFSALDVERAGPADSRFRARVDGDRPELVVDDRRALEGVALEQLAAVVDRRVVVTAAVEEERAALQHRGFEAAAPAGVLLRLGQVDLRLGAEAGHGHR